MEERNEQVVGVKKTHRVELPVTIRIHRIWTSNKEAGRRWTYTSYTFVVNTLLGLHVILLQVEQRLFWSLSLPLEPLTPTWILCGWASVGDVPTLLELDAPGWGGTQEGCHFCKMRRRQWEEGSVSQTREESREGAVIWM